LSVLAGAIGLKSPKKLKNVQADIDKVILEDESLKRDVKKESKGPLSFM